MRRIKPLHLFRKIMALFNMFIKNIHVSLCSIHLCLENGPGKKCIWKRICQIHQIRGIKYKYKYKYMLWNLIKYKYKYKYAIFVFVFVFANTNTYLTPALMLMYLDHFQNWLVHGHGLIIFLILALFWLSETGQFGVSGHFPENAWRKWPEILHADVSWPPSELISLWPWSVNFSNFGTILT